jgi:hypothetical protein
LPILSIIGIEDVRIISSIAFIFQRWFLIMHISLIEGILSQVHRLLLQLFSFFNILHTHITTTLVWRLCIVTDQMLLLFIYLRKIITQILHILLLSFSSQWFNINSYLLS